MIYKGIRENYVKMWYKAIGCVARELQMMIFVIMRKNIPINVMLEGGWLYL